MISIIDHGAGNIRSVKNAFEHIGEKVEVVDTSQGVKRSGRVVLPGVGSSRDAMDTLSKRGIIGPLLGRIGEGVPFLGICLGMQLLFQSSEETGGVECLGLFEGRVKGFSRGAGLKVPQIGWNTVELNGGAGGLFQGLTSGSYFYFVHSYYCPLESCHTAGITEYGLKYSSVVFRENVFAVQFHPERSQEDGLKILRNFARL